MKDEDPIRPLYEKWGVEGYYRREGRHYRNPHEESVRGALRRALQWHRPVGKVLDLGCGSGEMSLELAEQGILEVDACDPFTGGAFLERTGRACMDWSFKDLSRGVLQERRYELMIASYVLHLCPDSLLPALCWELSRHSDFLLVLSPHKRPYLGEELHWKLIEEDYQERVRIRLYRSLEIPEEAFPGEEAIR